MNKCNLVSFFLSMPSCTPLINSHISPFNSDTRYNAKVHPHLPKLKALLLGLSERYSARPTVVVIHTIPTPQECSGWESDWISWESFVAEGKASKLGKAADGEIDWCRQHFDWPLWILFSSGTTG